MFACAMTGGGWSMMGGGWAMMGFGLLATLAFWALIIWGGLHLYRSWSHGSTRAEDVLARRFASGEIDEEEYHRRRETLAAGRTAPTDWARPR